MAAHGDVLACACGDETTIIDNVSARVLRRCPGDTEPVTALCFTPDGRSLFIASRSLMVRVQRLGTGLANRQRRARIAEAEHDDRRGDPNARKLDDANNEDEDEEGEEEEEEEEGLRPFCRGHTAPVIAMAVDEDGMLLATASADRTVRVWDIEGGYCTHAFKGHAGIVLDVLFTPAASDVDDDEDDDGDGRRPLINALVTSDDEGDIRVWSLDTKMCVANLKGHYSAVPSLCLSETGLLLSAGRDKVVNVWNISRRRSSDSTTKTKVKKKKMKKSGDRDTDVEKSGSQIAIAPSAVKTIPVFESIECIREIPRGSGLPACSARDADDDAEAPASLSDVRFVTGGEKGVLRFWRADEEKPVYETASTMLGPKGNDGVAELFVRASRSASDIDETVAPSGQGVLCVMADSRILALRSESSPSAAVTQMRTERSGHRKNEEAALHLRYQLVGNHDELVDLCYIWRDDETKEPFIALATNSNDIFIYDAVSHNCVSVLRGHTDIVLSIDVIPRPTTGRKGSADVDPLLLSGSKDNTIRIWRINAAGIGACVASGLGHIAPVSAVAFAARSPCSFFLTGGDDRLLKLWDIPAGLDARSEDTGPAIQLAVRSAVAAHEKDINAIAVSPNNALVCSGSLDRTAKVWSTKDMRTPTLVLKGHKRGVWSVQFSSVDKLVLTASADTTLRLWDLGDGSCVRVLEGHSSSVLRARFLNAGTRIVSGGGDGLVKLWSVQSGECLNSFDEHEDKVWALAVSNDEQYIVSGGADATTIFWRDVSALDRAEEAARAGKLLLDAQRLSELMRHEKYGDAMKLGLSLRHPGALLKTITAHLEKLKGVSAIEEDTTLLAMIEGIKSDHAAVKKLLQYVREWNTNTKYVFCFLESLSPSLFLIICSSRQLLQRVRFFPYACVRACGRVCMYVHSHLTNVLASIQSVLHGQCRH